MAWGVGCQVWGTMLGVWIGCGTWAVGRRAQGKGHGAAWGVAHGLLSGLLIFNFENSEEVIRDSLHDHGLITS